ncbi:MAG TPA: hypothetical protein PLU71_02580 [Candidatus Dependentiae bacterium]|nr:hypothetical protein [Candidatus Dependentiae bacterium]HRQ62716.1 hypothetical protein [Candidatus Dependentiae bacterium]
MKRMVLYICLCTSIHNIYTMQSLLRNCTQSGTSYIIQRCLEQKINLKHERDFVLSLPKIIPDAIKAYYVIKSIYK